MSEQSFGGAGPVARVCEEIYPVIQTNPDGWGLMDLLVAVSFWLPDIQEADFRLALDRMVRQGWVKYDNGVYAAPGPKPVPTYWGKQ